MVEDLEDRREKNRQERKILNGRKRIGGEIALLRIVVELLSIWDI